MQSWIYQIMKLTIRHKLYGMALITAISLVSISLFSKSIVNTVTQLEQTKLLLEKTRSGILTLRRNEKNFLLRLQPTYKEKFDDNFQRLIQTLNHIELNIAQANLKAENTHKLRKNLNQYYEQFNAIFNIHTTIGLDHTSGLEGSLRKTAHQAENDLKQLYDHELITGLLMLRRNEKDFLMRLDEKYITKFQNNFSILLSKVQDPIITATLEVYNDNFIKLVEHYKKRGLNHKSGIEGNMRQVIQQTEKSVNTFIADLNIQITQKIQIATYSLTAIAFAASFCIMLLLGFIARQIGSRLRHFDQHMKDIAKGNTDVQVELLLGGNDELFSLANSFNEFVIKMQRHVYCEISTISDQLTEGVEETKNTAQDACRYISNQHKEIDMVTTAINEMTLSSEEITRNIHQATAVAEEAKLSSQNGSSVVQNAGDTIITLASIVKKSSEVIGKLESNSNNIGSFLDVIRGIAEQTNLLALNAAIEAARAGESGRGFAVVADEVRTLAQRTQESTEEIQQLIESVQSDVRDTVHIMQQGETQANAGVEEITKAINALSEISGAVEQIFEMNTQVATASEEQAAVTQEINRNVVSIADLSNHTSEESAKAEHASNKLAETTRSLRNIVEGYNV